MSGNRGVPVLPPVSDRLLAGLDASIQRVGFAVVAACWSPEPGHWHFAYTVGLTDRGVPGDPWPELLCVAPGPDLAASTIAQVAGAVLEGTSPRELEPLVTAGGARLRPCSPRRLSAARQLFPGSRVRAVQLVPADDAGRFPGDPGYAFEAFLEPEASPSESTGGGDPGCRSKP